MQYINLIEGILGTYPYNKIVWVHMGLSKQLVGLQTADHIAFMANLVEHNPNLYFDLSWRVVAENYFDTPEKRKLYLNFMRANPKKFITGTDSIAAS